MEKALIFLEPSQGARRGFLVLIEKLIRLFELNILKFRLKRLMKNSDLNIYSQDSNEFNYLSKNGIKNILIENTTFSQDQVEKSKKFSKCVAKEWYNQNHSHILEFGDINLGESTEQETMEIVDRLFKKFLIYELMLKKSVGETVYIENPYSTDGKAIKLICKNLGLKCNPLYPKRYGKIKTKFINKIKYRTYKKIRIDLINIYTTKNASKPSEKNMKILMDVPYPNHLDVVYPTIPKFISKGFKIYLLAKSNDISKYNSFLNIDIKKVHYKNLNKKIKSYIYYLEKDHGNIFTYENIDLWELIKDDLYYSHKNKLPALLYHLKKFVNVVEDIKPNIVIVGDDRAPSSVRIDVLYCRKMGIPHFEIQHGLYTVSSLMAKPLSDKIFIWGDATKDALIEAGADIDQMEITGSPKYDSLITKLNDQSKSANLPKTILFTTQPVSGNINLQIINEIEPYLKERNVRLIVKPHPSETADYYRKGVKNSDMIDVKNNDENTIDLLLNTDIVILLSSTVGIEAAILGKPMISVNLTNQTSVYVESGVALEVKNIKDLAPQIEKVISNDKIQKTLAQCREEFVYNYAYLQNGKASERVVEAIIKFKKNQS